MIVLNKLMSKAKHPHSRAERLRLKAKKDKFDSSKIDRALAVKRRYEQEALEQKEALDELRKQVLQEEEKGSVD